MKKLIVTKQHLSEYPNPIHFDCGTLLEVGQSSENETWGGWFLCSIPGQKPGWVPEQIIKLINKKQGIAIEPYTAIELNVEPGEILLGAKELNGWIWCQRTTTSESGWVPIENTSPFC